MWPQLSLEEASLSADKEMLTTLPDAVVVVSPGHPRKRRSRVLLTSARSLLAPGALLVALLVAWEIWVRIGNVPRYLAVAPSEVARFIVDNWGSLYHDVVVTNMEALYGLLAGTGIGMLLAILIVHSRILSKTLMPLIIGSQVVPKVAIAPLLLLWLGFGTLPKVIVASLMSFFPVVVSHAFGLQSVPEEILDLGRSMHAGRLRIFYKIRMPYSLPALF